jgi:hypothetical protein
MLKNIILPPRPIFKASDCGNAFQVDYYYGTYKYWFDGRKYYTQAITPIVKGVVEITRDSYLQACQFLKDNISLCGSTFFIWGEDGVSRTNYWFDGMYFYRQAVGSFIRSIAVKITKQEFINACANRF